MAYLPLDLTRISWALGTMPGLRVINLFVLSALAVILNLMNDAQTIVKKDWVSFVVAEGGPCYSVLFSKNIDFQDKDGLANL